MKTIRLVGVTGHANAGKDTFSDALVANSGFIKLEFAGKLKEILSDLYDIPLYWFYDRHLKNAPHPNLYGISPRNAAQRIGTEGFRNLIGASTWIDYVKRRIANADGPVVVSDIRFPDERDMIKEMGGIIVGIPREDIEVYHHESEVHVPALIGEADIVLLNNGTLNEYNFNIERTIEIIMGAGNTHRKLDVCSNT